MHQISSFDPELEYRCINVILQREALLRTLLSEKTLCGKLPLRLLPSFDLYREVTLSAMESLVAFEDAQLSEEVSEPLSIIVS